MRRAAFLLRYFYNMEITAIAGRLGVSESKVKTDLFRLRAALREFLIREGFAL
jgi:RNA polymerase sigma-70 factor (ECF subfamily)